MLMNPRFFLIFSNYFLTGKLFGKSICFIDKWGPQGSVYSMYKTRISGFVFQKKGDADVITTLA